MPAGFNIRWLLRAIAAKGLAALLLRDGETKAAAAQRWCQAVNNDGRFGRWSYRMIRQPPDLLKVLDTLVAPVHA